jgi:glycosyltransferase involved in cell wall biosynthesis
LTHPLLLCSKSEWDPPIRREHAWAILAAERGHEVTFVERPRDVRALRTARRFEYLAGLWAGGKGETVRARLEVRPRSTLLPGHRDTLAAASNAALLRPVLKRASSPATSIVFSWPWDWPAIRSVPARRRVFDMADDWGELMPGRRARFRRYYEEITAEADEIVIVNPSLAERFGGRRPVLVPNGVFEETLVRTFPESEPRTMIYVGTLTERFDSDLMGQVLASLPDWRLEIVGGCMYPGLGDEPSDDLRRLFDLTGRVRWRGPMARDAVIPLLDRAAVAVVPNRPEHSLGQDSMKFYDYAARGRPIVSTRWFQSDSADRPPHMLLADTPLEFAQAVLAAERQTGAEAAARRDWAAARTWTHRWPEWSAAVFGVGG